MSAPVPVWHHRYDLRRRFRRAACATMSDRKAEMTAVLRRLSADHALLAGVTRRTGTA